MRLTKLFKGNIGKFNAMAYDKAPENMNILEEHDVWIADDDCVFRKGQEEKAIIFSDSENINEWNEVHIFEE